MNKLKDIVLANLSQVIGEGAFSVVYKVFNKDENSYYAVKEVDLDKISNEDVDNL